MKICVFIGDIYRDYSLSIVKNLDKYAAEKGHKIEVFGTCSITTSNPLHIIGFKSILSLPPIHDYDAIILCYDTLIHEGMAKDLVEELLTDTEAPPVVCIRAEISGFYNVLPDNEGVMYEISKYIISKCKSDDIGFVTGMDELADSYERRKGFERAMHEAGYEVSEDRIFHGNYWITQGPEMADFFTKEDGSLPEAIICSNDYEAIAICNELIQRGYSIPADTMISGVDNAIESRTHVPSITTIEMSEVDFVDSAMKILEALERGEEPESNVLVRSNLILRESTGKEEKNRDTYRALCEQNVASSVSMDDMREFVVINALFEGALTKEDLIKASLDEFKKVDSVKSCFFFRYRENDRVMVGRFCDKGENVIEDVPFPNDRLLPECISERDERTLVYFSLAYKNEIYGYMVLALDTDMPNYINFKIEYLLSQVGENINKLELYSKLFGISDVMSLYIRDALTGVLNRRGYEQKLSGLFNEDGNAIKELAVVSVDMDGLKYINDNFGHNAGDEAIKETANIMDSSLNPGEFVARMGGDEFVAILILSEVGRVGKFIRNIRNRIKAVNKSDKYEFEIGASIGTCDLTKWHDVADCMNKADKAMYLEKRAKNKNRD